MPGSREQSHPLNNSELVLEDRIFSEKNLVQEKYSRIYFLTYFGYLYCYSLWCRITFFLFFKFIYLCWGRESESERERYSACKCGRNRERGRETIPSRLCAVSSEPVSWFEPTAMRSGPEPTPKVSRSNCSTDWATQALWITFFQTKTYGVRNVTKNGRLGGSVC